MKAVKSAIEVVFEDAMHPWIELRDLIRAAFGDDKGELQAPPVAIDSEERRMRFQINVRAIFIEHQLQGDSDHSIREIVEALERFHNASPFPKIQRFRHDVAMIEPADVSFAELVDILKKCYLTPTSLREAATDMNLIFDVRKEGDILEQVQLGPMDRVQIERDYLRWPDSTLPETFLFMNLSYNTKTSGEFAAESLEAFLKDCMSWSETTAESLIKELREGVHW